MASRIIGGLEEFAEALPKDLACRFLDEIQRNPKYWRRRLLEAMTAK